jgi:hypothetical protein
MLKVLIRLQLLDNDQGANSFNPAKSANPTQLQAAEDVLSEFGWTLSSFKHKCNWFGWAQEVAEKMEWYGAIPIEGVSCLNLVIGSSSDLTFYVKDMKIGLFMMSGWASNNFLEGGDRFILMASCLRRGEKLRG